MKGFGGCSVTSVGAFPHGGPAQRPSGGEGGDKVWRWAHSFFCLPFLLFFIIF